MIRIRNKRRPEENVLDFMSRLARIERWCTDNLEDEDWNILNINLDSVKEDNGSILRFTYFEFKNQEDAAFVKLRFGL